MTTWPGNIEAITLFTEDLAQTKAFYQKVFGLSAIYEDDSSAAFKFGGTVINLLDTTSAPELIAPAKVADRSAGARMQLTLEVDDVDAKCAELTGLGVEIINGPQDRPWGIRTAAFADPAGNVWEIAR